MISPIVSSDFEEAREVLERFLADPVQLQSITRAGHLMIDSLRSGGKILSCGNGGSMCDAMHFAEELSGRFRNDRRPLPALAISDPSYLTCTANDYGFDQVFSRFIAGMGKPGDVLLAISTSGHSANVVAAARQARETGLMVVALTGKDGGPLSSLSHVEIRAPSAPFADRAQEIHIKVIHSLIHMIEQGLADV